MVFKPGQSGNPGGKSPLRSKQAQELLLPHVPTAVQALVDALKETGSVRVNAAKEILDRVYGKSVQAHNLGESGDKIIKAILEVAAGNSGNEKPE